MYISEETQKFVKSKEKFSNIYYNKESIFTEWIRKETFVMKTKHTKSRIKDTIMYIPVNLSKIICWAFTDYVIGWWIKIDNMDFLEDLEREKNISKILYDTILKSSYSGYWIARIRTESTSSRSKIEDIKIDKIPVRNYYPSFDWLSIGEWIEWINTHSILSEVTENINNKKKVYIYADVYAKQDNWKRLYTKSKYETLSWSRKEFVSWNGWNFTNWEEYRREILDYLPLFIFNNSVTNDEDEWAVGNDIFWVSDISDIIELLQEYNDRYSQISVEFIKHLNSSISVPSQLKRSVSTNKKREINLQKQAKEAGTIYKKEVDNWLKIDWVDKVFVHSAWEQPAHYMTKELQTEKWIEWLQQVIRDVAWIKWIPLQFFNAKDEWQTETTATSIIYWRDRFNKSIIQKQNSIRSQLSKMFAYLEYLVTWKYELNSIEFIDPSPKEKIYEADYYIKLKDAWLISDEEIMQKLFWRDKQKIDDEIKLQEKKLAIETNVQWFNIWEIK